jgi:DNA-binding MarR family transcriptional regulator
MVYWEGIPLFLLTKQLFLIKMICVRRIGAMARDHQEEESHSEPLGFALGAAARKLAKFYTKALAGQSLTPSQLFLLRQLWLEDGLPLRDLGLRAQLDATSTTWLVDQLEHAGLVERRRNNPDRRVVRAWLTDAGRQAQAELAPALAGWEHALRQELAPHHSAEELATFRRVLTTLLRTLPEGDDLWEQLSASWDTRLEALRVWAEAPDEKG